MAELTWPVVATAPTVHVVVTAPNVVLSSTQGVVTTIVPVGPPLTPLQITTD